MNAGRYIIKEADTNEKIKIVKVFLITEQLH